MDTNHIRNFCIIAHIDHGKSTLADRMMELAGNIDKREMKDRVLDTLELEQERGITIKLQTARLVYSYQSSVTSSENSKLKTANTTSPSPVVTAPPPRGTNEEYILNLIDTPGHVDFSYEVSRSVAACEGALVLIDATQGIQAQTLSTVYKAMEYDLTLIPVLNKVDLPNAEVERVKQEVMETFGFKEEEILMASGKTGLGIPEILDAIVERVPAPEKDNSYIFLNIPEEERETPRALIFDAFYHEYKGVVALVKMVSGNIQKGQPLFLLGSKTKVEPIEIGYLTPKMVVQDTINEGEVGYVATGLKDIGQVRSGDTITIYKDSNSSKVMQLEGYKPSKPMVYASLYPVEASDYPEFSEAIQRLSLNDAALTYQKEHSQALGTGFVCGFLGLLHLEITQDRLEREFGINLISTVPTVEFKVHLTTKDYAKVPEINIANIDEATDIATIRTAAEFPDGSLYDKVYEPWVKIEIMTPEEYIGPVMELSQKNRGVYKTMRFLSTKISGTKHAILHYEIPTLEIITNFFDNLKSITHGYASMDYSFLEYREGNIVKVGIMVNYEPVEALSFLCHRDNARRKGKNMVEKLKDIIPKQQFKIAIQSAIGGEVIARETVQAYRKDVIAGLYGGDETRKKKLLENQKKGKKKMKMIGNVEIPKEAFLAALKNE